MKQVGVFLRQMHEVKTKKYGYLTKPGVGEYSDLKTWFNNKKYVHLADLQKKRLYSATKVNQFKKLYQKYSDCLADVEPSLLHHDLTFENVIVKNGRITGIIDAGDVMSGDPAYELACMHQHYRSRRLAKPILEGYGVIDMKKLYFYALFQSLWWVKYFSLIKKGDHFSRVRRERANVEYYLKKLK
jgi:aminoglycoside phosphotransferase (APT) family kinase protein